MAKFQVDPRIGIVGIGSDAPETLLTNADLEKMVDTNDEWIRDRSGNEQRHVGGTTSGLGIEAAQKAMAMPR